MNRTERLLLLLLVASIFINYIDRANLSIAVPVIQHEWALSPVQVGSLLSAFFYTYAGFQLIPVSGWLVDRFPVGLVFAGGFLIWSIATLATGLVSGFAALFLARLVLGAGESVAYPCYSRIFASAIPQHHRGRANALLDAGSKVGPALSTFLGGLLLVRFGWRAFFIVLCLASLLWLLPWFKFIPRLPAAPAPADVRQIPSVADILSFRSAWGTFAGHFCGNYFWFFLLTWLPSYLEKERGFSIARMANVSSLAYLVIAASTVSAGWLSDRAIARGASVTRVRKTVVVAGLGCSAVVLPVAFTSATSSIAFLLLACIAFGTYTSNHWAITQTLAGPLMAGRWTSFQNGVGNLSGLAAASFTGFIVERTGSFHLAFVVAAVIAILGALIWALVVGRVEPVERKLHHYPSPAEIQSHS